MITQQALSINNKQHEEMQMSGAADVLVSTDTTNNQLMKHVAGSVDKAAAEEEPTTNAGSTTVNIILVHGAWSDGSAWSKVIPILQNAGHKVIAVQLPLHSLKDDVATVKRAISLVGGGGPTILVGHSYGGFIITNAAYNNKNVTGLVYIAAYAPKEN